MDSRRQLYFRNTYYYILNYFSFSFYSNQSTIIYVFYKFYSRILNELHRIPVTRDIRCLIRLRITGLGGSECVWTGPFWVLFRTQGCLKISTVSVCVWWIYLILEQGLWKPTVAIHQIHVSKAVLSVRLLCLLFNCFGACLLKSRPFQYFLSPPSESTASICGICYITTHHNI